MCVIVADELKHVKDVLGRTQDEATLLEDALNQQVHDYKVKFIARIQCVLGRWIQRCDTEKGCPTRSKFQSQRPIDFYEGSRSSRLFVWYAYA